MDELSIGNTDTGFKSSIYGLCFCPITKALFVDPVVAADSHTYERAAIAEWLSKKKTSPATNLPLEHDKLTGNQMVRNMVQEVVSSSLVEKDEAAVWHYSTGKFNLLAGQFDTAQSHFQRAAGLGSGEAGVAIKVLELKSQAEGLEDVDWMFPWQVQKKKRRREESEEIREEIGLQRRNDRLQPRLQRLLYRELERDRAALQSGQFDFLGPE